MPAILKTDRAAFVKALQITTVLAAALLVCIYMTYGIDRPLWLDEANTVHISTGAPRQIIASLSRDVSPPLYYLLLSGWIRLFGYSEVALRLPSVIFYLAGICVMWLLGRKLLGIEGAGLAAFMYAVDSVVGRQAQNARMYTMLGLMAALSLLVFLNLAEDRSRRTTGWFALFGVISFVGLNTHYWFAFVLIAYAGWIGIQWRTWRLKEAALFVVSAVLPFLFINLDLFLRQSRLPATLWTPAPNGFTLLRSIAGHFGLIPLQSRAVILRGLVLASPIIGSMLTRMCNWKAVRGHILLLLGFLYAVALGIPFLISLKKPIFWAGRYDIVATPLFALFAAAVLLYVPIAPRRLFQCLMVGCCAIYFVQAVQSSKSTGWLATLDPVPLGDRAAAMAICGAIAPGDFVVYTGLSRAAVSFYLQRLGCSAKVKQVSYPAEVEQHMGWEDDRRNYAQELPARREAESVTESAHAAGARIFLLYEPNQRLSSGIIAPIERRFRYVGSQRFSSCGWCFDEVRVYVPIR